MSDLQEELKLRVKSLEQTEALLRQALAEQQEERQRMTMLLTNRFAGGFPKFSSDTDAMAVVQHLSKCLDYVSQEDPEWYGDMIDKIGDATNNIQPIEYRVTNLLRVEAHNFSKDRVQTFIFPDKAAFQHYLYEKHAGHFTRISATMPFYAKPHEQYFVHANNTWGASQEFVASDIHQALDVISAKGWKLKWMEAVG